MQLTLAIGTCERAASLVLLTACALLPRRRQPRLRAIGHDGHLALDISATRPVGATSTPQSQEDPAAVTPTLSRMAQAAWTCAS